MPSTQDLRRKIKSVKSTAKLTRAMQMVAASKMNKAVQAATASRKYSDLAWSVISELSQKSELSHPYFEQREQGRIALVLITSNRGLAGGFNSQAIRLANSKINEEVDIITIGRKGAAYMKRFHPENFMADFPLAEGQPSTADSNPIVKLLGDQFISGKYRRVEVVYNKFESTLNQVATVEQILPVAPPEDLSLIGDVKIEPSPDEVLEQLLRRIVPARLYQLLLDSAASEHSARMIAMKSATDNANEIADDLTLTYQSVRQANITREIIEVSSGAAALAS